MFVVFEGIDGSGKTTVSNRVAKALTKRGVQVDHVREDGEFRSALVSRMREFGKDTRNLALLPLPELLLYVARDVQLLGECVMPLLQKGGLVFADRYLYSYEVLGHHGRGLPKDQVHSILDAVAGGVWPSLVVLMDVDPHVARARRRVAKIGKRARGEPGGGGSRKGLGGIGMLYRVRQGYLELAEADPGRWLVVDNTQADLDEVVEKITELVFAVQQGVPVAPSIAEFVPCKSIAIGAATPSLVGARDAFYRMISARSQKEPQLAAYFLAGLVDPEAYTWRTALASKAPNVVAYGLRALGDEQAWELRQELAEVSPVHVAKSLAGLTVEGERAERMREALAPRVPRAVLSSIGANDGESAWRLRTQWWQEYAGDVVASLKRLDTERAWELRQEYVGGDESLYSAPLRARPLLESIRGLHDERAWEIREASWSESPVQVLRSLSGLECERSWKLRKKWAHLAPRAVLATFDLQDNANAWALRESLAPTAKEALDSMIGLDGNEAWRIRRDAMDVWPSTVAKSLGALACTPKGQEMMTALLQRYPNNLSLLKHATQIAYAQATAGAARRAVATD